MSDQMISKQIESLFETEQGADAYITVRQASKKLNVKQTEIKDNIPDGFRLLPSNNGTLSEARIVRGSDEIVADAVQPEVKVPKPKKEVQKMESMESFSEASAVDVQEVDDVEGGVTVETEEPTLEDLSNVPETEIAICTVCGNRVRKTTMTRRGICPLCFRTLVKNSGQTSKALMALSDDDFDIVVGQELGKRRNLEEYKVSRTLSPEEFEARKEALLPVKTVFAAAKEAGFGPGRTAQAMGGDRFRHEPLGGFGSVWTPFFYGPRKGWYFDKDILNHLQELSKPEKPVVEKKPRTPRVDSDGNPIARSGPRGGAMKVVKKDASPVTEPESSTEEIVA